MLNLNFLIILFIGFVDYLGIGLVYPVFAVLLFDSTDPILAIEASAAYRGAALGLLIGLTPLSAFVFAPMLGSYSDTKGRRKTLLFGMLAGTLGYVLAVVGILYHSLSLLLVYRILVGITEGTAAVAQAAVADISDEKNKARRFSLFSASLGFGFAIGPFIGGILADPHMGFGYATPFCLAGVLCVINYALVWGLFPESRLVEKELSFQLVESLKSLGKAFTWKELRWLFAAGFCLSFAWAFFNEFMPVLLQAHFGFNLTEIGRYFAWGGLWYSLSSGVLSAPLLKRFSSEKLVQSSIAGCALTMAFFSVIADEQYVWLALPVLMYCLAIAFPTLTSIVSNRATSDNQGEILGVYHAVSGCAMGLSPLFIGSLIGAFPALTGWGGGAMMLLACLFFWIGNRRSAQEVAIALD